MHYPFWHVPGFTAPILIAAVAVFHIFVALYAVGGGIFLAVETRYAYRNGNTPYLAYLKQHAWFFILLTVVYGAITGVGIWWTIGLAGAGGLDGSPVALVHGVRRRQSRPVGAHPLVSHGEDPRPAWRQVWVHRMSRR